LHIMTRILHHRGGLKETTRERCSPQSTVSSKAADSGVGLGLFMTEH
jgi:hypothetical protein